METPFLWVVWAVGTVPEGVAGSVIRLGTRLAGWARDPAGLVGTSAAATSVGLGLAAVLALGAWAVGLRYAKNRRRPPPPSGPADHGHIHGRARR